MNTILRTGIPGFFERMALRRWKEMASPSRSLSEASSTSAERPASWRSPFRILALPRMVMYSGSKPFSTSTARRLLGRSTRWPIEAATA